MNQINVSEAVSLVFDGELKDVVVGLRGKVDGDVLTVESITWTDAKGQRWEARCLMPVVGR